MPLEIAILFDASKGSCVIRIDQPALRLRVNDYALTSSRLLPFVSSHKTARRFVRDKFSELKCPKRLRPVREKVVR
jgi:hypothetical protein